MRRSRFWEEVEADYSRETTSKTPDQWREIILSRLWCSAEIPEYLKMKKCGRPMDHFCASCGEGRSIPRRCGSKMCPHCARHRAAKLQAIYVPTVEALKWPLFVTFTIGGGAGWNLDQQLSAVRDGVKKIRRQRWWKEAVRGGVGSFELKWSERGWHVHWHAVLDCRWLAVTVAAPRPGIPKGGLQRKLRAAQREVADQWAMAVGYDPSFIFIRRAKPGTAQYVVKYSVKPSDFNNPEMPINDLVHGMAGSKLVAPWGSVRKIRRAIIEKARSEKEPERCKCGCVGKFMTIC